jgi:hypothetical protein
MLLPTHRARTNNRRVKHFRATKASSVQGMGNGPSPLRCEVKVEDVDSDWDYVPSQCSAETDERYVDWGYSLHRC